MRPAGQLISLVDRPDRLRMRIAVIGAGIVGITSAYELALDGHEVTVFERRSAAAEEASFANAGLLSPGMVAPWATPGMKRQLISQLFSKQTSLRATLPLAAGDLGWVVKLLRASKPETYLANRSHMLRLARYSCERLQQISEDLKLEYDYSAGSVVLLRSEKDSLQMQAGLQLLREAGVAFSEISADQARKIEPAINADTAFFGALQLPDDHVANCRQFALLLKAAAQRLGVKFEFNTAVACIVRSPAAAVVIAGESQPRPFERVVLCAGMAAAALLRPLGLRLPVAIVQGYSVSAPIREPLHAPRSAVVDARYRVIISRLGNRVRVAGSYGLGGDADQHRTASLQMLYKVLHDWFPGAAQHSNTGASVQEWKGACAMLPDGPPLVGDSGIAGLWLNTCHGDNGWLLSCGSARALAELMSGKPPAVDMSDFGLDRPGIR